MQGLKIYKTGPSVGFFDSRYVNVTGGTMTGALAITSPTATTVPLTLQTTDDNATNNILEVKDSGGSVLSVVDEFGWFGSGISSPSAPIDIDQTSSATLLTGLKVVTRAGYSGASSTYGANLVTQAAGTGTGPTAPIGNFGFRGNSAGVTTGLNIGVNGEASGGNKSYGVIGLANTDKDSAQNVGVFGVGLNGGAGGYQIGGYFGLDSATPNLNVSAALIADNDDETSPIFIARDNGTAVTTIADGGAITTTVTTASLIPLTVKAAPSQTANLTEWQNSSGTALTTISKDGEVNATSYTGADRYAFMLS